ncbi:hypothetical protein PAXRUDRAFT_672910 [Paxillus rubicundulus Ve08.2h10]|uniref:Uncharacterized protein n=1 Tax=Paxillus rubicundulus Ve08.2h10 TaxID=930991 RepID=A0A0D0DWQ6_9AGAM|nr:hypothetical protein PAXRUDRAFT_672910 [Paxillus rubicundulus Ve08.2h10]
MSHGSQGSCRHNGTYRLEFAATVRGVGAVYTCHACDNEGFGVMRLSRASMAATRSMSWFIYWAAPWCGAQRIRLQVTLHQLYINQWCTSYQADAQ